MARSQWQSTILYTSMLEAQIVIFEIVTIDDFDVFPNFFLKLKIRFKLIQVGLQLLENNESTLLQPRTVVVKLFRTHQ